MEKERKIKILSVVALIVAVLGLTVAFAALSQTLQINGTAVVQKSTWQIDFANLDTTDAIIGHASFNSQPTIDGTTLRYGATFTRPGDGIEFSFKIVNSGDIDAKLQSLPTVPQPMCSGTGDNAEQDAAGVCDYLDYSLTITDKDGNAVTDATVLTSGEENAWNAVLTLEFVNDTAEQLQPANDVNISNLDIVLNFVQAN